MSNLITPTNRLTLAPQNMPEALQFAEVLAKSTIVPRDYQGKPANILVAMLQGMELGLGPIQALQGIAVINGRPSVWGDTLLAIVQGSGLLEGFSETQTDDAATCVVKRKGIGEATRVFTVADAKKAGLWGKQGPWSQYPKRMMQMRARSFALRDMFADVLRGIQSAEEQQDIPIEVTATLVPEPASQPLQIAAPNPAEAHIEDDEQPPFGSTPVKPPAPADESQKAQITAVCKSIGIDGNALGYWLKKTYGTTWVKLTSIDAAAVYYDISGIMSPFQRAGGINSDQMSLIKSLGADLGLSLLDLDLDCRNLYEGLGLASLSKLQAEDYTDRLSVRVGDLVDADAALAAGGQQA